MTKLLHIHIPKTGGTSLNAMLDDRFSVDRIMPPGFFAKPAIEIGVDELLARQDDLSQFDLVHAHLPFDSAVAAFPDHARLTVLRDPIKRVVSLYNDWRTKSDENYLYATERERTLINLCRSKSIGDIIRTDRVDVRMRFCNGMCRQLSGRCGDVLSDDALFAEAMANLETFDVVGITEELRLTWTLIGHLIGGSPNVSPQHMNPGRYSGGTASVDGQLRGLLESFHAADIRLFEHAKGMFTRQVERMGDSEPKFSYHSKCSDQLIPLKSLDLSMRDPLDGEGWHVREGLDQPIAWRWTGPSRDSSLRLAIHPGCNCSLRLSVISYIHPDIIDGVHLVVNGQSLKLTRDLPEDDQTIIRAYVPADLVDPSGVTTLLILVPRTASHHSIDPQIDDRREKGIAVSRVRVDPAD